jgi:hypothetical protein
VVNGKNCEIHELQKELEKWKDIAAKKSAEAEELERRIQVADSNCHQPSTTERDNPVTFTGIPSDLSTVSIISVFSLLVLTRFYHEYFSSCAFVITCADP